MGTNFRPTIFTLGESVASTREHIQNDFLGLQDQIVHSIQSEVDAIDAARVDSPPPAKPAADPLSSSNAVSQCLQTIKGLVKTSTKGRKHMQQQQVTKRAKHFTNLVLQNR